MSMSSDGGFNVTPNMLQKRLEKGISAESLTTINDILTNVGRLSNIEKLFLYLKLPTHVPAQSTAGENGRSSNGAENVAFTWIKSHVTTNEKTSLLRQKIYDDYRTFCKSNHFECLSLLEFKRTLHSIFPDLTTRRFGRRGNAKHVFGGISYQTHPETFALPQLNAKPSDEEIICDGAEVEEEDDEGVDEEEEQWKNRLSQAAGNIVLEWAYKLLNLRFHSVRGLAKHLLSQNYVSQVSPEAFTLAASTSYELLSKEEASDTSSMQKTLQARHHLQKKLQERREISKQRQRMEEERNQVTNQDATSGIVGKQTQPLPALKSSSSNVAARAPVSRSSNDADKNLRKQAILPKTLLLPKLTMPAPVSRSIFDARRVDQPQFIVVPQNMTPFQQCGTGSVVLISNQPAPALVPTDGSISFQTLNSFGVAPVPTSSQSTSQDNHSRVGRTQTGCYRSPTHKNSAMSSSSASKLKHPVSTAFEENLTDKILDAGDSVQVADDGRSPRKIVSADVGEFKYGGSAMLSSSEANHTLLSQPVSFSSPTIKDSLTARLEKQSGSEPVAENVYYNQVTGEDGAMAMFNTNSSIMVQSEPHAVAASTAKQGQSSRGRGRGAVSRSAPKTVSSILDEQRCSSSGVGTSRALYNDSRNVSQILKELREKTGFTELHEVDHSSSVRSPLVSLVSPNLQVVKLVQPNTVDKVILDVQSAAALQVQGLQSGANLHLQPVQSNVGLQLQSVASATELQSPSAIQNTSGISDILLLGKSLFQIVQPPELVTSPAVAPSQRASGAENVATVDIKLEKKPVADFPKQNYGNFELPVGKRQTGLSCDLNLGLSSANSEVQLAPNVAPQFSFLSSESKTGQQLAAVKMDNYKLSQTDVSTSEARPLHKSENVRLQQLLSGPIVDPGLCSKICNEDASSLVVSSESLRSVNVGEAGVSLGVSESGLARSAIKRSSENSPCKGIKRLLMGNDLPKVAVLHEEESGEQEMVKIHEEALNDRVNSPGCQHQTPYKNQFVQHCTLQQLSDLQQGGMCFVSEPRSKFEPSWLDSRPASVMGHDRSDVEPRTQPGRPNTVAMLWDEHSMDIDTDVLPPFGESSGETRRRSAESCSSLSSTPISVQSPRSNLSCGGIYLDQSSAFMPIHISDAVSATSAFKPLPKIGHTPQSLMELGEAISSKQDSKCAAVTFMTTAGGFTPYTNPGLSLATTSCQTATGFASASSIRPVRKTGSTGGASRQRHHSAHDAQDSCAKTVKETCEAANTAASRATPPEPAFVPMPCFLEASVLRSVASSINSALIQFSPDFDLNSEALEVDKIISAGRDQTEGVTSVNRSQSVPANCFQLDLSDVFASELNSDSETISGTSARDVENLGQKHWNNSSILGQNGMGTNGNVMWNGPKRGDHMISGIVLQPSMSFPDNDAAEFSAYGGSCIPPSYIGAGCSPPQSQNPTPEFDSEMPLFDKAEKVLDAFPSEVHPSVLDTPNSLVGIFNNICGGDDGDGQNQPESGDDFGWSYFQN